MALVDNLVSYWKMDEASGTRADAHGSNTLADNNTVASGTGIINNGADFETSSSEYLSIADGSQSGLDVSGDFSIQAWIKFESLPSSNAMGIVTKITGTNATRAYFFDFDNGWHSGANRLLFITYESSTLRCAGYTAWTPSTGTWYHIVATHNATAGGGIGSHTFYINGSAQTTSYDVQTGGAVQNTSANFLVGADDDGGIGRYFDGIIDEVGVWSRELSGSEVTELYNAGAGLAYPLSSGAAVNSNFFTFF